MNIRYHVELSEAERCELTALVGGGTAADRFKPGTYDGAPAVIGQSVEVSMQACVAQINDNAEENYIFKG